MTLHSRFLHTEAKQIAVSKLRLILGVAAGVACSFCIYFLLYMGRESLRLFSHTEDFDLWVLYGKEVWFFNLFIAYISTIFGLSVCLMLWFGHPSAKYGKFKRSFAPAVNDLFNLNVYFLSWMTKLALVWGIFLGWTAFDGTYAVSLFPDYIHIFILIIVVLFFNSWITLLKTYKNRCLKWMGISFLIVSALAFALSSINITDYRQNNETVLSNNLQYAHGLELPVIDTDRNYFRTGGRHTGSIGITYECDDSVKLFFRLNAPGEKYCEVTLSGLMDEITRLEDYDPEEFRGLSGPLTTFYALFADKRIPMIHINRLKVALRSIGIYKFYYCFIPANDFARLNYLTNLSGANYSSELFYDHVWYYIHRREILDIKYVSEDRVLFNERPLDYNELKEDVKTEIQRLVADGRKYVLPFYISNAMSYEAYMKILTSCYAAVYEIRDEESLSLFGMVFDELDEEARNKIAKKYPMSILELTEDMVRNYDMSIIHPD